MQLTEDQVLFFQEQGYLLVEDIFSKPEVDLLLKEMLEVIKEDCPRRILEKSGSVRSFFAPNTSNVVFDRASRYANLLTCASQLLDGDIYLHQSKINSKAAMVGDWWEWHQDYTYWQKDDGMPGPNVLTAMVFLNPVTEFNGPMLLIPKSHNAGVVDDAENVNDLESSWYKEYVESAAYLTALTSDLKYTLKQNTIAQWVSKNGMVSAKGAAGTVLFFHGNIFHASSNNLSPWDRHTYLLTYNRTNNKLPDTDKPRPEFIAMRNFEVAVPVESIL